MRSVPPNRRPWSVSFDVFTGTKVLCPDRSEADTLDAYLCRRTLVSESEQLPVVFIVDSDEDVRAGFARLMRSFGLEARPHESPEAFLEEARHVTHGCVLIDVAMPRITAPELLRELRRCARNLPVIVVSTLEDETARSTARALGAQMFLRKPVDEHALIDAVSWATGCSIDARRYRTKIASRASGS